MINGDVFLEKTLQLSIEVTDSAHSDQALKYQLIELVVG